MELVVLSIHESLYQKETFPVCLFDICWFHYRTNATQLPFHPAKKLSKLVQKRIFLKYRSQATVPYLHRKKLQISLIINMIKLYFVFEPSEEEKN